MVKDRWKNSNHIHNKVKTSVPREDVETITHQQAGRGETSCNVTSSTSTNETAEQVQQETEQVQQETAQDSINSLTSANATEEKQPNFTAEEYDIVTIASSDDADADDEDDDEFFCAAADEVLLRHGYEKQDGRGQTSMTQSTSAAVNEPRPSTSAENTSGEQRLGRSGKNVWYQGPISTNENPRRNIDLIYDTVSNHFNTITSVTGCFSANFYCRPCRKTYTARGNHKCSKPCKACYLFPPCPPTARYMECDKCNRLFNGINCFRNHTQKKANNLTVCQLYRYCKSCKKTFDTRHTTSGGHRCFEIYCRACKCFRDRNHHCYMSVAKPFDSKKCEGVLYIFFDIETDQSAPIPEKEDTYIHKPILLVSQQNCVHCCNVQEDVYLCNNCGIREQIFLGETCVVEFMKYVLLPRTSFKKVILCAHNLRAFDGMFLLQHMSKDLKMSPNVILNGSKILTMSFDDKKFVDSLNFIPMPLRKIPSVFGFEKEVVKGYFPYLFIRPENYDYRGDYPHPNDYGVNEMSPKEKDTFMKWYATATVGKMFDFKIEIVKYCRADVSVLRRGVTAYCQLCREIGKVDPLRETITLASVCLLAFRRSFLKADTLGLIPHGGYRLKDTQSHSALMWLNYIEHDTQTRIQHSGNGREKYVYDKKVDGYSVDEEGRETVYFFHGCLFHGCPRDFPNRDEKPGMQVTTSGERYEATLATERHLREKGVENVRVMWECDYRRMLKDSPEIDIFVKAHAKYYEKPLDAREALYGGRTQNSVSYFQCVGDEKVCYYDICSLYPFVLKTKMFPIGHPTIYLHENCPSLENIFGIVKACVLPPRDLFIPVLPHRHDGKLLFPLCRSCMLEYRQGFCNHENEADRWFVGCFVSEELKLAVRKNYKIVRMFEAWHFSSTVYDKKSKSGGLFSSYIDTFFKLKCESSGFPPDVKTTEQKKAFINEYEIREGIKLDESKMEFNAGRRALTKMLATCLWGKLSQRNNLKQFEIVQEPRRMEEMLDDTTIEISGVLPVDEDTMYVSYKNTLESDIDVPNTNVVIAAFTTAWGRMELYRHLEQLGDRAIYWDTDSVIFKWSETGYNPEKGNFLGDMTCELEGIGGEGSYITEFCSGGPKNYTVKIKCSDGTSKTVCKCRGLTINAANENIVHFDTLKQMVLGERGPVRVEYPRKIVRNKKFEVFTTHRDITYQVPVVQKRWKVPDMHVLLPYGYVG
ncbi:UNVERIFIED_CONTAM: hypothetical protein B566_EDAN018733 [Ephemera danica]|nr:hypothetical protein B566_EDAN018733 [Ephemera danica]